MIERRGRGRGEEGGTFDVVRNHFRSYISLNVIGSQETLRMADRSRRSSKNKSLRRGLLVVLNAFLPIRFRFNRVLSIVYEIRATFTVSLCIIWTTRWFFLISKSDVSRGIETENILNYSLSVTEARYEFYGHLLGGWTRVRYRKVLDILPFIGISGDKTRCGKRCFENTSALRAPQLDACRLGLRSCSARWRSAPFRHRLSS